MRRVYFIKPVGMDGPIKIGCSMAPVKRRDALAAWSPFALEVVIDVAGDFSLERRLHKHFAHLHQRREWFTAAPDLLDAIEKIKAGEFDFGSLTDLTTDNEWRGRRPLPEWLGKQVALARQCSRVQYETGFGCPVDYNAVYRHGRTDLLAGAEAYLADPATHGVACDSPGAEVRRAAYLGLRSRNAA